MEKLTFQIKALQTGELYTAGTHVSGDGHITTMNIFYRLDGQNAVLVVDPVSNKVHKLLLPTDADFEAMLKIFMKEGCLNLWDIPEQQH